MQRKQASENGKMLEGPPSPALSVVLSCLYMLVSRSLLALEKKKPRLIFWFLLLAEESDLIESILTGEGTMRDGMCMAKSWRPLHWVIRTAQNTAGREL